MITSTDKVELHHIPSSFWESWMEKNVKEPSNITSWMLKKIWKAVFDNEEYFYINDSLTCQSDRDGNTYEIVLTEDDDVLIFENNQGEITDLCLLINIYE